MRNNLTGIRDFKLVGHGSVTNEKCGRFSGWYGCLQYQKHGSSTLDHLEGLGDVIYARKHLNSCDKSSCPTCYRFGWAVREAALIEGRLAGAIEKGFGEVDHLVCSLPESDYDLGYDEVRVKIKKILFSCGVTGGVMIFHGHRYNKLQVWYFSPHMHVLGFIRGGFGKCRTCQAKAEFVDCKKCDGVMHRLYDIYHETGYIVKVLGERITVGGTAWYQLHHSSIDMSKKRFRVTTWFGSCGYRNLKVKVAKRKTLCPLCHEQLGPIEYVGSKSFVLSRHSPDFKRESYEEYIEDGNPVWVVKELKPWRS